MSLCTGSDMLNEMAEKPVNTVVGQHVVVKFLTKNCLKTTEFHAIFKLSMVMAPLSCGTIFEWGQ